jgi:hypothetical protein
MVSQRRKEEKLSVSASLREKWSRKGAKKKNLASLREK